MPLYFPHVAIKPKFRFHSNPETRWRICSTPCHYGLFPIFYNPSDPPIHFSMAF